MKKRILPLLMALSIICPAFSAFADEVPASGGTQTTALSFPDTGAAG